MSKENLRLTGHIACIDACGFRATLISTLGNHCEVWRSNRIVSLDGGAVEVDRVIKRHRLPCTFPEIRLLNRDYQTLKARLGSIVPEALFVATEVDGELNVVVIADTVQCWFNLANPANESDAVPLLRRHPRARDQLSSFLEAAREWYDDGDGRLIDLYGLDNLVLDVNRQVRYIDSFNVFFYPDLLEHCSEEDGASLREMIQRSLLRLEYLEYVHAAAEQAWCALPFEGEAPPIVLPVE